MAHNLKGKTILIIGGGFLQVPVIKRAKELGLKTVVVDYDPNAAGVKIADDYINSSTLDADTTGEKVYKYAQDGNTINGVLTVGTDASYTVAVCAQKLKLPGITPEIALNATDKYLMRKTFKEKGVPVPDFRICDNVKSVKKSFEELEGDCVIKPLRNMGARGVRRVSNHEELLESYEQALSFSRSGKVLLEQYIQADELSIDALIYNGEIIITGVADRIIEYEPYFVETGHVLPSNLPENLINSGLDVFKQGIRALGINLGFAKGDIRVTNEGSYVGEIAARLSGGFMSAYTYPYATGVDLMENAIYIALGLSPEGVTNKKNWVSVERAIIAAPGTVNSIEGIKEAENIKYVDHVFINSKVGDRIETPMNNLDKSGHVIISAPTRIEAVLASHKAVQAVKIKTTQEKEELIPDEIIRERAIFKFNGRCFACKDCSGKRCRGMMPGVGGIDSGLGFIRSVERVRKIQLIPHYINTAKVIDTSVNFMGYKMNIPIFPAPITGAVTNLGGAITELELARSIVKGANQAGTLGVVGDGATPTKFKIGIQVIMENFGMAIPFFKPRYNQELIIQRIAAAREAGAFAVGMDIDAASFLTMRMKNQNTSTKSFEEIKELVDYAGELPFILKGVLAPRDAELAVKAGVKTIIVSNHGGRVGASLITPIDALPQIKRIVGDDMFVILDGGLRSGPDVAKAIAMGADAVMIGRPVMVSAVGGGVQGVRQYFNDISRQLMRIMTLIGTNNISDLKGNSDVLCLKDFN